MPRATALEQFFAGYPESKRIYAAVERAVEAVGAAEIRVTKSQIAFRRRRAFAWTWIPGRYLSGDRPALVLSIALPRRDRSSRWKQVVEPRPGRFMHHLELDSAAAVDAQVGAWIREAWSGAGPSTG